MMLSALLGFWLFYGPLQIPEDPSEKPTNIILVICDGMGLSQIALAEYLTKPPSPLAQMEVVGLQKIHSANNLETDSAASGTAMSCGVKTFNAGVGVDADSQAVASIMDLARAKGIKTGFIVTSSVVHATPAAFYAHAYSRAAYEAIAAQLIESGMDVFVGGGEKYFVDRYSDNSNLLRLLEERNYAVFDSDRTVGNNLKNVAPEHKIALFTAYEDPLRASTGRRYFPDVTVQVIEALEKRSDKGYFLMVEASQVDWAAHANKAEWLALEMQDAYAMLDKVLAKVQKDQNTLLIVTADHECGYMSLAGKRSPRVKFHTKVHSSQMVPVFATGPGAEEFLGIYDNTAIFDKMKKLLGL